jgi:hypothetical protein
MRELIVKMVAAGVLFGAWPLVMNRSGLNGATATAALSLIIFLLALPVALRDGIALTGSNWWFAVVAGCCSGLGFLAFNSGLAEATPALVGRLFVIMILVQMAIPAAYHVVMNGQLTARTGLGFVAALIAAILLV